MKIFHTYLRIIKYFSYFTVTQDLMTIKNNFILSASITYILETKIFDFPYPKWCLNVYFSLTLIVLFISSDTFHFKLFCLVILFFLGFTFPFLVTKYHLGHCWMYFILDFCSLCRSFCRKKKDCIFNFHLYLHFHDFIQEIKHSDNSSEQAQNPHC